MSAYDAGQTSEPRSRTRNWVVETLVVLGIVGFGYFALTMDDLNPGDTASLERPANALLELVR
jgi:hypothetical protein